MKGGRQTKISISATFFAASLIAFAVLNRWIVTDIGLLSYGRIWPLYVSYSDFGFVRRALVGTILSESGLNSILDNEYHLALAIHHIAIVVLASAVSHYCISRKISNPLFLMTVAFSPALIIHSGYSTGSLDIFVIIFATINVLFVRSIVIFSLVVAAGTLTHELFIFTVPAQFLALLKRRSSAFEDFSYGTLILPASVFSVAIVAITVFGTVDMPRDTFERIMRQRIPIAEGQHGLWSGYFEIASTVEQNAKGSLQKLLPKIRAGFIYLSIPLSYIVFLIARLRSYSTKPAEAAVMTVAVVSPLFAALVATDYYRWVAMSANMAILLTLVVVVQTGKTDSRWNAPLLLYCVLAPFGGAAIDRPFPMHQFIIERLLQ